MAARQKSKPEMSGSEPGRLQLKSVICYRCQKEGHTARFCRAKEPQLRGEGTAQSRRDWAGMTYILEVEDEDDPITGAVCEEDLVPLDIQGVLKWNRRFCRVEENVDGGAILATYTERHSEGTPYADPGIWDS